MAWAWEGALEDFLSSGSGREWLLGNAAMAFEGGLLAVPEAAKYTWAGAGGCRAFAPLQARSRTAATKFSLLAYVK